MRENIRWTAWASFLVCVSFAADGKARACDNYTNGWVRGVASYWHGTLGKAEFCNNRSVGLGANRQAAADCAWSFTLRGFPDQRVDTACARQAIEMSPQGKADLDEFTRIWTLSSGMDCSPAGISLFAPHWHGALGKQEYCNNATVGNADSMGPDRERAKECAFQALVRDKGVAPTSCLREAIADSPQGKADLDEFMRIWNMNTGMDCSPAGISLFAPHWHGALGKEEYCNNAAIGPDREKAKECAFQALVRDKGVAHNSCLRDAIADSPQGKADLDDFMAIWCRRLQKQYCADSGLCVEWADPQNCGRCGNVCGTGTLCCQLRRETACHDPSTDAKTCGGCGNACTGGKICQAGSCACPAGVADCGGTCRRLSDDAQSCGACGNVCQGAGKVCVGGKCACPSGLATCFNDCRNLSADVHNCGGCGAVCNNGWTCQEGKCRAQPGTLSVIVEFGPASNPPYQCRGGGTVTISSSTAGPSQQQTYNFSGYSGTTAPACSLFLTFGNLAAGDWTIADSSSGTRCQSRVSPGTNTSVTLRTDTRTCQ